MSSDNLQLAAVTGRRLAGTQRRLPDELPAHATLVVVAFRQWQQRDFDAWIALAVDVGVPATPLGAAEPMDTAGVELAVLGRRWLPARGMIDGGMATSIADPAVLARTNTASTNSASFRRRCGIRSAGDVTAMLAARDGSVSYAQVGPPGPDAPRELAAALGG